MTKEIFKWQWLETIPDQWDEWACTAFAMCNIINWFKEPKYKKQWLKRDAMDWHQYFDLVNSVYPPEYQWSLAPVQALVYAKNNLFIDMYQQLFVKDMTPLKFKKLLDAWFLFLIVVNKCDWTKTKKSFICEKKQKWWLNHSVAMVWYDDKKQLFKFVNSRWPERWDKWYFYMRYDDINHFIDQIYAVHDSDDKENFQKLLYKSKILSAIQIISDQWQRWTDDEKKAMNFANTMLRKVVMNQNHQYNMSKSDLINFINKYF